MSVWALYLVKNEADIIGQTLSRMLAEVDHVLVLDNGSTDDTREICEALGAEVRDDPEIGHYQSRKLTALAHEARERGAEWVVPADADERWQARDGRIADVLRSLPSETLIADAVLFDHVATGLDGDGPPLDRIQHRRPAPEPLHKIACRTHPDLLIGEGNHSASYGRPYPPAALDALVVRHFPYRSLEQTIRKLRNGARAFSHTNLPPDVGAHWRAWGEWSDEQIETLWRERYYSPDGEGLVCDPCP